MNTIFTYEIEGLPVKIIQSSSLCADKEMLEGFKSALCEYFCYEDKIISPRIEKYAKIAFSYDENKLASLNPQSVSAATHAAVLRFLDENPDNKDLIVEKYVTKPHLESVTLEDWIAALQSRSALIKPGMTISDGETLSWVEFNCVSEPLTDKFYGRYKNNNSSVLLVFLPSYDAEWRDISAYYNLNCDILQLSPLGYNTPTGFNNEKKFHGAWPVLYDTVTKTDFFTGYNNWFLEVIIAVKAFLKENQSLVFVGTSQGGAAALVLSSIFNDKTAFCAAEMPFLIGFSDKKYKTLREVAANGLGDPNLIIHDFYAQERLFCVDPVNHTERIKCRTLICAGENDTICPACDIFDFYNKLTCEKEYSLFPHQSHGYTDEFKEKVIRITENEVISIFNQKA